MLRFSPLLLLGLLALGCGKGNTTTSTTVRGYVSFQGRALADGVIVFAPDREKGNSAKTLIATVAKDGGYHLDGTTITPGWYRIAIADPPGVFREEYGFPKFPPALRRPDRSGLEREILAGKDNILVFEIDVTE